MSNQLKEVYNGYSITGAYTDNGDKEGFVFSTSSQPETLNTADFFRFLEENNINKNLLLHIDFNKIAYTIDKKSGEPLLHKLNLQQRIYVGKIKHFENVGDFQYFCPMSEIIALKKNSPVVSCADAYGCETIFPLSEVSNATPNTYIFSPEQLENTPEISPNCEPHANQSSYIHFANDGADKLIKENPDVVEDVAGLE